MNGQDARSPSDKAAKWAEFIAAGTPAKGGKARVDAVLQDKTGTYVFEFKYGKTAREALNQAKTKEYGNPWLDSSLPVFHVGVNYDPEKRGIDDPLVESAVESGK